MIRTTICVRRPPTATARGQGVTAPDAESAFAVEARPTSNNQPSFGVQDEDPVEPDNQVSRTVKETAKVGSSVGNAVTATDSNNDPLLYRPDGR